MANNLDARSEQMTMVRISSAAAGINVQQVMTLEELQRVEKFYRDNYPGVRIFTWKVRERE